MIIAKNIESLWTKHREEFLKLLYSEQPKVPGIDKLAHRYTDKQGRRYFGWERDADIPTIRYAVVMENLQLMIKGLSAKEDELLDNHILSILEEGVKDQNSRAFARASAIIMERQARRKMLIHTELCYSLLCSQIVREDENPYEYSNVIQAEKIDTLMNENSDGHVDFFFRMHELKRVRDLLGIPKEDWASLLTEYQVKEKRLKFLLEATSLKTKSTSSGTTLIK